MGKFSGYLICTDLDGTLYRDDKTVSEENRRAIEYFKSEGGLFTFITGRLPCYSQTAYDAAKPNAPYGCMNGGGVWDGETGKYLFYTEMPDDICDLVEDMDKLFPNVGIQIYCPERVYFSKENDLMPKFRHMTGLPKLNKPYREIDEPIVKVIFGTEDGEAMQEVIRALHEHPYREKITYIQSEPTLYEVLPKGVNKGLAFGKLIEILGIDREKTIAIGDYDNDVGMLREAGLGIAVSNSSPAALAAADLVTVSNNEDALAKLIYDLEAGKIDPRGVREKSRKAR